MDSVNFRNVLTNPVSGSFSQPFGFNDFARDSLIDGPHFLALDSYNILFPDE